MSTRRRDASYGTLECWTRARRELEYADEAKERMELIEHALRDL